MRKLLFLALFLVLLPWEVNAQIGEHIVNYQVNITVEKNSDILVSEKIEYNFETAEKHGIFRIIPYRYKSNLGNVTAPISDISVKQDGQPAIFDTSKSSGTLEIKIGDKDKTISGTHLYEINYRVSHTLGYFEDHDELYWNAVGTSWQVPILKSAAIVTLPEGVDAQSIQVACYTGGQGSQEQACTSSISGNTVTYSVTRQLDSIEGLTIVTGFPKGVVSKPSESELLWQKIVDNWVVIIPILIFGLMFYLWNRFGKDAKGRGTIVPEYNPPKDLIPIEVGTMVDGSLDRKDISAEIIYLAEQGYINIKQIETKRLLVFNGTDYELTKIKSDTRELSAIDKGILDALFDAGDVVKLSSLKTNTNFGTKLHKATSKVYSGLVKKGYYRFSPQTAKVLPIVLGIVLGIFSAAFFGSWYGIVGALSGAASGLIIIFFGFFMPAKTKAGASLRESILGLKDYINYAEKDRIRFHNAPEKTPARFEMLLPFAMVLGAEKAWAKQFEGIYNQNPTWYSGVHPGVFNAAAFTSGMDDFADSVRSMTAANASRSGGSGFGGGGFSGGGGGGGGGGSW